MGKAENPTVSVIIPTYNRAHLVGRAIRSVLNQTYQDFEIIVVDDGSTDNTEEVVKGFNDDRIRYIRHDENKGGAAARNTGIKAARGEYIAFLDSDDEWLAENLEKKVRVLNSMPTDIGLTYSKAIVISSDYELVVPKRGIKEGESVLEYLFLHRGEIPIHTLLVRSSILKGILFDEDLEKHQDWDLVIRLGNVTKFSFMDEPLAIWHDEQREGPDKPRMSRKLVLNASLRFIENHRDEFMASKKALASFEYGLGRKCLREMHITEGRRFLRHSISLYPLWPKPIVLYLSTFFGTGFTRFLFKLLKLKLKAMARFTKRRHL